jgi:hypothetical protein
VVSSALSPKGSLPVPSVIPSIAPMGIRPQFQRIKPYLKSYTRGFDEAEYQRKLANLQRYAAEGEGFVYSAYKGDPLKFDFSTAFLETIGVYWVTRWLAIQGALGGAVDWHTTWQRSVAYGYWGYRMDLDKARDRVPRSIRNMVFSLADCLVLGWQEWALDLAQRVLHGLDRKGVFFNDGKQVFSDYNERHHPRTQIFVLRLIADWQGWPQRAWAKWAFEEPIFNALLEHWRTPDANALQPLLLAACDRHTHESRSGGSANFDIEKEGFWYDPFEVLAVMKLRQLQGLENPVVDHLLMNTPLGKLPEPVPPYSDALLEGVIARVRLTHPEF